MSCRSRTDTSGGSNKTSGGSKSESFASRNSTIALLMPVWDLCGNSLGLQYKQLVCAGLLATADFNRRVGNVVPTLASADFGSFQVKPMLYDTSYDTPAALQAMSHALEAGAQAIIGTARSQSTQTTAQVAGIFNVPTVSYWASAPLLSERDRYPLFARTYASDAEVTQALCRLVRDFGWRSIGVVYDRHGVYSSSYAAMLRENAPAVGVQVVVSADFNELNPETYAPALEQIKQSRVNVIIAVLIDVPARLRDRLRPRVAPHSRPHRDAHVVR
jgi:hypothetical protein